MRGISALLAIAGYKSELDHALNAQAIYLGPGK